MRISKIVWVEDPKYSFGIKSNPLEGGTFLELWISFAIDCKERTLPCVFVNFVRELFLGWQRSNPIYSYRIPENFKRVREEEQNSIILCFKDSISITIVQAYSEPCIVWEVFGWIFVSSAEV